MPKSKKRNNSPSKRGHTPIKLNAMTIRRSPKTFEIDLKKLQTPEWMAGTDHIFLDLYVKYLTGRIPGFLTRMPIDMIKEGFYLPARNFEYLCDAPPDDVVDDAILRIQQGARPPLHLYRNSNPNDGPRFLCPDDVVSCIAYKRLNFGSVPVIVLAPGNQPLPFSALETKASVSDGAIDVRICGLKSREKPSNLPSILKGESSKNPSEDLKKLTDEIRRLIARLRLFHVSHLEQMHYHHMLFSALVRAQETLEAIDILIEKNLWYQALALLRVLYEIHLNFYFDWLQPETNYRYLAAATVFNAKAIARQKLSMSRDLVSQGIAPKVAEARSARAWQPVLFASNVAEKAKLPKIGVLFHNDIYDFLSQISHQNFEVASLHANRFEDEKFLAIDDDVKTTYLRFMDFIVSEFAVCIDEDIGIQP